MKILIAGGGKVGALLTKELVEEGHDITLIDLKQEVLDNCQDKFDVMTLQGNCASMDTLETAGVREAEVLVAASNADEVNLLCCLTAHAINPKLYTIARIRNPEYSKQIHKLRDRFFLSMAVNPEGKAASEVEHLLKFPGFLKRDTFAKGRVEIVELRVDAESKLKGIALNSLDTVAGCKILVCIVLRKGQTIVPGGDFVLQEGDRVFVTGPTDNMAVLLRNLGIITHKVKKVMICGGGKVSYYLAQRLSKSGMEIQLIEKSYERCLELADKLPEVCVIQGDATSQSLLESEDIQKCDALVAMTGMDEQNIIISLYGKSRGVPQVITKIGHLEHTQMIENLSIGSIVSPKELCINVILRYIRALENQTGGAITLHSIADGHAEALEFKVDQNTKYCGIPLKDIQVKKQILITTISHRTGIEIADGNSSFNLGDTVVIVSSRDEVIYQLNDIFE